tara:strand:- start:728 stop:1093 length:366 start_codon:yes stop_codon:yes gene_type:complete
MATKAWNTLIEDPKKNLITGTSGIGPWSDSFASGGYGQTLSTTGIGPWKSGEAYGSALKGAKGLSGAQKANIWSAGLKFASRLFDKSSKGKKGVSNAPGLGNQLQAGSHDWMKFFQNKFIA